MLFRKFRSRNCQSLFSYNKYEYDLHFHTWYVIHVPGTTFSFIRVPGTTFIRVDSTTYPDTPYYYTLIYCT